MADDIIDLRSVNWSQGMFLTPDHFTRQEKYFDSMLLWVMRYASLTAGLVGGGPRVQAAERGAARFDPIVDVDDSGDTLKIAVTQARGITAGGALIDIDPANALSTTFPKRELEASLEIGIYVVARPHDKEADGAVEDPINPQLQTGKRSRYRISLEPRADEAAWSLLLTRIRRSERGLRFERVPGFIPPCAMMASHSDLMDAFRQLNETIALSADRYSDLHRAIVDFVTLARARGLNVEQDLETLSFVSRMVTTLEECAYRILDPLKPPVEFFKDINQLIRSAALFLSLSPPTRRYFRSLAQIGETDFMSLLEQESEALKMGRNWSMHDDLGVEVRNVTRALERLDRLEQALEGKYMDYRISPSLERINFVFDTTSGEPVLYRTVTKYARPQAMGQQLTFVFSPLNLDRQTAREKYRIIVIGDRQANFGPNDRLTAEVVINRGEGYQNPKNFIDASYEVENQRNFAFDFAAPSDINSINDVRVSLRSAQPIRSAMLYVRERILIGDMPAVLSGGGGRRALPDEPPVQPYPVAPPAPIAARDSRLGDDRHGGYDRGDDRRAEPPPPAPRTGGRLNPPAAPQSGGGRLRVPRDPDQNTQHDYDVPTTPPGPKRRLP
jgi:hypothetical protein